MSVDITNVADTFGNELKLCLYSVNPEVTTSSPRQWQTYIDFFCAQLDT